MKQRITHLLLDLDGTLVDGNDILIRIDFIRRVMKSWSHFSGPIKTLQVFHKMKAAVDTKPNGITNDLKMIEVFAEHFQIMRGEAESILESSLMESFLKLRRHFYPVSGAAEFIHWAKHRYGLILATNPIWMPEIIGLRVTWAGLSLDDFGSLTHARKMHSCKPRLEYYLELLEQEKLIPSQCLMIGNDPLNDLPASEVGIPVYLLSRDMGSPSPKYQKISVKAGSAEAWNGNYTGLRQFLDREYLA
jgi:FMN phosphatase YigB (HAD superfamily)